MKFLRLLFAISLVCGACLQARADDFQMIVIDPPPQFPIAVITTPTFTFQFSPCETGQAPGAFSGCFSAVNATNGTITALSIGVPNLIPNNDGPGTQPATCDTTLSGSFFTSCTPQNLPNGYILNFTGGDIPNDKALFTIAEQGADPAAFGTMTAQATTIASTVGTTPEPGSLILLSTGMLSAGGYLTRRKRVS